MSMRSITRKGRRAFLQGASFALALPFLETLAPRTARGQTVRAPKRFLGYMTPNGMWMPAWRPTGTGSNFQLGPAMGPKGRVFSDGLSPFPASEDGPGLDAVLSNILILTGLQNTKQDQPAGDHAGGFASLLTNRTFVKAAGGNMGGPSIDYVIAQGIGQSTPTPFLALCGQPLHPPGYGCDNGYSCAAADHISYDAKGQDVTTFDNPGAVFDEIFSNASPNQGAAGLAAAAQARALNQSILDYVTKEATSLQPQLSYQDRPRFDQYLSSVREVERRIATAAAAGPSSCTLPTRPAAAYVLQDGRATIDLVHKLIGLAFQCDVTRVMSLMWGSNTCQRPHDFIGASGGHHNNSHHGSDASLISKIQRIDYWWFRRFSEFLVSLKGMPDIDGRSVLDNTIVFHSSDISDGNAHNHNDMPVVLAGGACGFKMGQHIDYTMSGSGAGATGHWFGELFISIAQALGVNITTFGEHGTAPLSGLT